MVGVVKGVLGCLSIFHPGEVDAAPLEENQRKTMNGHLKTADAESVRDKRHTDGLLGTQGPDTTLATGLFESITLPGMAGSDCHNLFPFHNPFHLLG